MDLEIIAAIITFILGLVIGYIGRERWGTLINYMGKGYTIATKTSEVLEKLAGSTDGLAVLIEKVKEAVEDGKITKEEVLEILQAWEKFRNTFDELKEAVDDLKNALLVEGSKK